MSHIEQNLGTGKQIPPDARHVAIYFMEKGQSASNADAFFNYYQRKQWLNAQGVVIRNWKVTAWEWIWSRPK